MKTEDYTQCAVDGHPGVYCWQIFAQRFPEGWEGCAADTRDILLAGPDGEDYWEAVSEAEDGWQWGEWTVLQSAYGDIVLIHEDAPLGAWECLL